MFRFVNAYGTFELCLYRFNRARSACNAEKVAALGKRTYLSIGGANRTL
jgi:hypothetical protein